MMLNITLFHKKLMYRQVPKKFKYTRFDKTQRLYIILILSLFSDSVLLLNLVLIIEFFLWLLKYGQLQKLFRKMFWQLFLSMVDGKLLDKLHPKNFPIVDFAVDECRHVSWCAPNSDLLWPRFQWKWDLQDMGFGI